MPEMNMAKRDQPFVGSNDMMTQNFEQTDATDLKRKIKDYLEKKHCCCERVYTEAIRSQG